MCAFQKSALVLLLLASTTSAFYAPLGSPIRTSLPKHALFMSSGKGFGESPPPPPETPKAETGKADTESTVAAAPSTPSPMNPGQKALAQMRREKAEQRDAELRRVKEIRSVDEFVRDDPSAAAIPEPVAMRMGKRMLPFVGIPLFGGMGAFVAFWYLATYKDMEFQPGLVAASTIALLVVGLLGITYSVMSASWDPDEEGSTLGVDEFSKNLGNLQDGLKRSKENLILRETMAGMPEAEIESAIRDLDRRDSQKLKKQQSRSLSSKLENELE